MEIIGFNFNKISIEKKKEIDRSVKINTNLEIKDLRKETIDLFKGKDTYSFSFQFKISYTPGYAESLFEGAILTILEPKLAKRILKEWKTKKIPEEIRTPLFNLIMSKCNLKALQLEEDLNLPKHLPLPRITPQPDQTKNISYTG